LDGSEAAEAERLGEIKTKEDAEEFGIEVARILVEHGAGKILEAINLNRKIVEEQGNA
jgi:hydroxymethylbilane synthase